MGKFRELFNTLGDKRLLQVGGRFTILLLVRLNLLIYEGLSVGYHFHLAHHISALLLLSLVVEVIPLFQTVGPLPENEWLLVMLPFQLASGGWCEAVLWLHFVR